MHQGVSQIIFSIIDNSRDVLFSIVSDVYSGQSIYYLEQPLYLDPTGLEF